MRSRIKRVLRHWLSLPKEGHHYVPDVYGRSWKKQVDPRANEQFRRAADEARKDGRTLLYYDRLYTLYQALENISRNLPQGRPVRILEVGVYKGGGSRFLASLASELIQTPVEQFAVDTFEGHSAKDLPDGKEGGHVPMQFNETEFENVKRYLADFPFLKVLKGRIQDTITDLPDGEFDFIHLDMDIYGPTLFSLSHFDTRLPKGGIIVMDDYGFTTCPGIRQAVEEYLMKCPDAFVRFELLTGQCLLIKR